jgi:phenylalanyl-tRNA synthetase beta chain
VALWTALAQRVGLADVVVRSIEAPRGLHPTRTASLVDRTSGALLGYVGEVDLDVFSVVVSLAPERRLGILDVDLDAFFDPARATRRSALATAPSRFPSAAIDLAFVSPDGLHAADLALELRTASTLVERVTLFDVYRGPGLAAGARSLAYAVRFNSADHTLSDEEIATARQALIDAATRVGAELR